MLVVWLCVVGWIVVVVVIGAVGRVGCLSLLLMKSFSIASHFEPSPAVVSQVVSLVGGKGMFRLSSIVGEGVEEWNSVEVPSRHGSSQWISGCVDNRSGFGEEDDSNTREVGERELVLVFNVL